MITRRLVLCVVPALLVIAGCDDRDPVSVAPPRRALARSRDITPTPGGLAIVGPSDINAAGHIVGYIWVGDQPHAAIQVLGQAYDLGTIDGAETSSSYAVGISDRGQVVGSGYAGGVSYSFVWTPDVANGTTGTMRRLDDSPNGFAAALDVNDAGQVVGTRYAVDGANATAVIWSGGAPIELGSPLDGGESYPSGINGYGQVAAAAIDPATGIWHAALWTPSAANGTEGAFAMLCPECGGSSTGAINDFGQVVLSQYSIWTPSARNGVTGTVVTPEGGGGMYIADINSRGDVVGWVSVLLGDESYIAHAVLWRPTEPNGTTGISFDLTPDLGYDYSSGASASMVGEEHDDALQVVGQVWSYDYASDVSWTVTDLAHPPLIANAGPGAYAAEATSVRFDGSRTTPFSADLTYQWNFGDGTTGSGVTPNHSYADNGNYAVTLTVTDATGRTSNASTWAAIYNLAPTATLRVTPAQPNQGQSFALALGDAADAPADLASLQFAFDCGDGRGLQAFGSVQTLTCGGAVSGPRFVRGAVRDKEGATNEYSTTISVTNVAPSVTIVGAITADKGPSNVTIQFRFTDPGTQDAPWSYVVDWGDGTTSGTTILTTQGNVISSTHRYSGGNSKKGVSYTVTVRVTDMLGGSGQAATIVTIGK